MNIVITNLATADATHNRHSGGRNPARWRLVQDDARRASVGSVEQRDPRGRSTKIFLHAYLRSRLVVIRRLPRGLTRTGTLAAAVIGARSSPSLDEILGHSAISVTLGIYSHL